MSNCTFLLGYFNIETVKKRNAFVCVCVCVNCFVFFLADLFDDELEDMAVNGENVQGNERYAK